MLTPTYLWYVPEKAEKQAEELHNKIVSVIIERMMIRLGRGEDYLFTPIDKWQMDVLQDAGYILQAVQKEIAQTTKISIDTIAQTMKEAGIKAIEWDDAVYKKAGLEPKPLGESPYLQRLLQRNYEKTKGEMYNYTGTMPNACHDNYINAVDKAYTQTASGTTGYTQAVKEAVNDIINSGADVTYPSGHRDSIETATTRAVRTGVSQMAGEITDARMDEMNWDIILTSAHLGARIGDGGDNLTNHYWWQGKFYSKSGNDPRFPPFSVCGMGNVQGIHGANCRHSHGPGDGINNPFEDYDSEENRKEYEKRKRQRELERRIRKTKRQLIGMKTAVDNAKDEALKHDLDIEYQKKAALLQKQNKAYNDYCEENNLKKQSERLNTADWNRSQASSARGAATRYNNARGK